jgi:arylsulfate sulfotransferase
VQGAPAQSGTASTLTLQPKEDVAVTVRAVGGATRTYTVHYVPSDLPPYTVWTTSSAGTEPLLLSLVSLTVPTGNYLLMMDRGGMPLYYRTFPQLNVENFQQVKLPGGATFYTCTVGLFSPGGWTLGADHVMDSKFQDVADFQLPAHASHGVLQAEGHDFVLLDTDHYVALSYQQRTRDLSALNPAWSTQALVMDAVVQEVKAGQVLFEWDTANFPSLQVDSVDMNAFTATALSDYLHVNSLEVDPADGNVVVSIRHTNSIVKISHTTGQILWTLGGKEDMFGLTATQTFSHQHHVRVHPDGSMTVFDNGNGAHQSRVLRFVLDETSHTVTQFDVLAARPTGQPAAGFMGSITPLAPTRMVVGWGGWFTPATAPAATEIISGNVTWSMQFQQAGAFSYRALPITL